MSWPRPKWSVGDVLEENRLPPVSRLQLIEYAGASGDYNPIHIIDEDAHKAGLLGVIAHGMLTAAMVGRLFSPYLQHGFVKELGVRFAEPVFVGDELHVGGRVTGIEDTEGELSYAFEVHAAKAGGEKVASGMVLFHAYRAIR